MRLDVRAEHVVQVLVGALADQVQVDLAEGRAEPIRVVELPGVAVWKAEPDPIRELSRPQLRHEPGPKAVPQRLHRLHAPVRGDEPGGVGIGMEGTNHRPVGGRVCAENRMGFVVLAARQAGNFVARGRGVNRRHRPNHTRAVGRLPAEAPCAQNR